MKREKLQASAWGTLLGFAVSWGAVGCLLTGFDLNLASEARLWLACGLSALVFGLCMNWKWGGAAALGLLALWSGYLWLRGELGDQVFQLLYRITYCYDRAYGWGTLRIGNGPWGGAVDLPLLVLGVLMTAAVCHTVCRGRRTWPVLLLSVLPLASCLVVTDTVPEEKYLFCLLLTMVLLMMTASMRSRNRAQSLRLLGILALPVAAVLAAVFLLIPQEDYVNQSEEVREKLLAWVETLPEKLEDAGRKVTSAVGGDPEETVSLQTLGRQSSLSYPVMDVTSDFGGAVYLREQDYDAYDGLNWTATPHRSEEFFCDGEDAGMVYIETRSGRDSRFLPYYPQQEMTLTGGMAENPDKTKNYYISRQVLPGNWRSLVKERSQGRWESEIVFTATLERTTYLDSARYLLLPNDTRERAKALLETILSGESTSTEKADAIAAFVRNSAEYDRDPGRMPGEETDFALWFLEDSDKGYCVHFATAAVVLLRAADIPARYVTGYMVACPRGEAVTVTADMCHAWAEYYEPQLGCWIPLEATPEEGLPQTSETEQTQPAPTPTESQATEPEPEPSETQPQTAPTEQDIPQEEPQRRVLRIPVWLILLPLAVLLVWGQRKLRLYLRRSRRERGKPNDRALACWREAEVMAKLLGEPVPDPVKELAQKAKFSQHTLTEGELAEMEGYISDSVSALASRPWYLRLVYRYVFAVC